MSIPPEHAHLVVFDPSHDPELHLQQVMRSANALHQNLQSEEALELLSGVRQLVLAAPELAFPETALGRITHKMVEVLQTLKRYEEARCEQWTLLGLQQALGKLDWEVLLDVCSTSILDTSLDAFLAELPGRISLDAQSTALLYKDLGNVMCSLKCYPEGLRLFQLGMVCLPEEAPIQQKVDLLNGIAGVYTWTERFKEALLAYQENHHLYQQAGDVPGQIQQLLNMAQTLQSIPRIQEARATLKEIIRQAEPLGMLHFVRQAHYMLAGLKGLPRAEAAGHLLEYARLEVAFSGTSAHEPLLMNMEVRQNQQNFDFQKSMRMELQEAYQRLYDLNAEREILYERLEKQAEEFERLANTDPLTGLPNRRLFFAHFEREFGRVKRSAEECSVVLMDIDHFKSVNDTFSHKTGDLVLKIVADLLRLDRRQGDLVARYGGEEFVLLLPGASALGAKLACERIQKRLSGYSWHRLLDKRTITMSFGVSDSMKLETIDQVLMQADERLYRAKNAGRNRIVGPWEDHA